MSTCRKQELDQVRPLENLYNALKSYNKWNDLIPLLSSLLKHVKKEDVKEHYRMLGYISQLVHAYLETKDGVNALRIYSTHTPFLEWLNDKEREEMGAVFSALKERLDAIKTEEDVKQVQEEFKSISVSNNDIKHELGSEPKLPSQVEISG